MYRYKNIHIYLHIYICVLRSRSLPGRHVNTAAERAPPAGLGFVVYGLGLRV